MIPHYSPKKHWTISLLMTIVTQLVIKPGMFANLSLTLQEREDAITVPEAALMMQREKVNVFVVDKEDRAQLREITVGKYMDGMVEVLTGVAAGEKVIVEGIQKIGPGIKVFYQKQKEHVPTQVAS